MAVVAAPTPGFPDTAISGPLFAAWLDTPLERMLAVAHDGGLALLEYADRATLDATLDRLRARFDSIRETFTGHPHLATIKRELADYFAGRLTAFTVPVDPSGTPFERRAWAALGAIPFGQTLSYGRHAAAMGSAAACRAVGRANGRNTINIVIPCHRVVAATGELTGYGGGLARKRWLLDHERRVAARGEGPVVDVVRRTA
ncbi:MAG TPA: methylated-DNA--[protein]-cysteine S-methyltransferase [Tepidisphaeraceae bacterium]|nr:methylated-DNA--[protein]-cysteine S-methyltransferase [Tepidisphaeraceae bacterium]